MAEYLVSVVVMSALLGLISYLSYPGASERAMKFAASVLLLYTALTPALTLVSKFSNADMSEIIGDIQTENGIADGGEYKEVAESAFKDGIRRLLFTKYGISEENVEIFVFDFDFENMKAEKIKIILSGKGAFSDWRGIEEYITEQGLGECEAEIEFG